MMQTAIRFSILMMLWAGLLYPLAMTGLGQLFFPSQAEGSLIRHPITREIMGSRLIGQAFTRPEYFHPRPAANGYDAANSGGSNNGPTSQKLIQRIRTEALAYQRANGTGQAIPVDAVTTSASGLDPDISVNNALMQVNRVARFRRLSPQMVRQLIWRHQEQSVFTERPYVNVLQLNLALDCLLEKGK